MEKKLLLAIAREAIEDNSSEVVKGLLSGGFFERRRFIRFAQLHEMMPLVYDNLRKYPGLISKETLLFLKNQHYCILTYTTYLWEEFCRINNAFGDSGISVVPIKGVALLKTVYAGFSGRTMVDIDLLIQEEDISAAERIFLNLGYHKELFGLSQGYWRDKQTHFSFYKADLSVSSPAIDLHWALDFKRNGQRLLPFLWERIIVQEIEGRKIRLLSREDLFYSLVLHQRRFGKILCLKYAIDTILLLKNSPDFDWEYVLNEARRMRLNMSIFFLLAQAEVIRKDIV
ncbi:MAG: nucleotidyltransferase family protein, partial [Candidatus Omnitrophica bacterium]|nr:nucleotidyltransferase family protein [Candidatus Omnitrophota bacterium]